MPSFKIALQAVALPALMLCVIGAAYFSIGGMALLFPAAGFPIVFMAAAMQIAKLIVAGWLVSHWRETFWLWRLLLVVFVLDLMLISAVGLYSQLAAYAWHNGEIVTTTAAAPIQYVAALLGRQNGADEVLRWLIAAMVLCCDPFAVVVAAVLAARRPRAV